MTNIKQPLLLIRKSSPCNGGSSFPPLSLSGPIGGIAPNQAIARSEFEVHRESFKE